MPSDSLLDYINPCKKYKYFIATSVGEMPTPHKYDFEAIQRDLETCKKGWPDRDCWKIFRLVFARNKETQEYDFERIDMQVETYWQQFLLPGHLTNSINAKYPRKAVNAEVGHG